MIAATLAATGCKSDGHDRFSCQAQDFGEVALGGNEQAGVDFVARGRGLTTAMTIEVHAIHSAPKLRDTLMWIRSAVSVASLR